MEHVRSFVSFPGLDEIRAYLKDDANHPAFQKSELYSSKVDQKIVDEDLRKSQFRIFEDDALFQHVERVVKWLNDSDSTFVYQLRRDNITQVNYEASGHFLKHKDFLSITSNLVEEFTLILCVTPEGLCSSGVGGETLIYPYASENGTAYDTTTPGNGLLFRKDLEHAGGVLKSGEKHILTANILATRKQCSEQVLFVSFPSTYTTKDTEEETTQVKSQGDILQSITNQGSSYVLPVDCLRGTMLDGYVRFFNQEYDARDDDPPKVVNYHCTFFGYQEFGTIAKILLSSYIQEEEITKHSACIDFFGPFANAKLLVNLAVEDDEEGEKKEEEPGAESEEKNCKRFVQPSHVTNAGSLFAADNKKVKMDSSFSSGEDDFGVIVCENESRTKAVYEVSRLLGFSSYVPFKMVFVRGVMLHGYYNNPMSVPLSVAGLVVGDYNHIFALQNIGGQRGHTQACSVNDYHTTHNYFSQENPPGWDETNGTLFAKEEDDDEDTWDDNWEEEQEQLHEFLDKPRGLSLRLALGDGDVRSTLSGCILGSVWSERGYDGPQFHELRPLSDFIGSDSASAESSNTARLFHLDESGKATFTADEAEAASKYISSMDLDGRVLAAVQKKRFELTQEMKEADEYYCNESTYSNLSLLYVTGLIRLDPSFEATSTATTLPRSEFDDVWPTKAQRKAALIATQRSVGSYVDYGYIYDDSYFHHSSSDESEDE